jgi:ketosteroid isomerase-like protein
LYEAINAGDLDAALAFTDPDFEWIPSEGTPFDDHYVGRELVKDFFEREWLDVFDDLRLEVRRLLEAPGGLVVALVRIRGRGARSGAELVIDIAHLWRIRAGMLVHGRAYPKPKDALEAAGLQGTGLL